MVVVWEEVEMGRLVIVVYTYRLPTPKRMPLVRRLRIQDVLGIAL